MIFRSIKFNVVLFLAIAFLAALGTLLPQVTDSPEKVNAILHTHPLWGKAFSGIGLFDIYHHPVFAGLLGLMAFDVVACKLWNRPPDQGLVPLPEDSEEDHLTLQAIRKKPYRLEGVIEGAPATLAADLAGRLKERRYRVKQIELPNGGVALLGARHRLQRWGSYVSHISLVVILLGAVMKSLMGFETFLPILEGRSANVADPILAEFGKNSIKNHFLRRSVERVAKWELWVDKLTVDFYRNSSVPSTFASRVRLFNDDQPLAQDTIRVNQPLDVHHVRFYQASWGVTGMVKGALLRVGDQTLDLAEHDFFPIPGQPWKGRIDRYLPDFTIAPDGEPGTASLEWHNPALAIGFYNKAMTKIGTLVLGAPSPAAPSAAEPWAYFFTAGTHMPVHPPFEVLSAQPVLFSGIQVSYDPGFPVIVTGVLAMLAGLAALFYLHQRRVIIFLRPEDKRTRVDIGAWSSRQAGEYKREFQDLFGSLRLS